MKTKKFRNAWLVQLAMGTIWKITQYVKQCPVNFKGYFSAAELNIFPLGSYHTLVGMDLLDQLSVVINYLEKIVTYVGTDGVLMVIKGKEKPVMVRQISTEFYIVRNFTYIVPLKS